MHKGAVRVSLDGRSVHDSTVGAGTVPVRTLVLRAWFQLLLVGLRRILQVAAGTFPKAKGVSQANHDCYCSTPLLLLHGEGSCCALYASRQLPTPLRYPL